MKYRVYNKRNLPADYQNNQDDYIYIGRPSIFGNPFSHKTGTRTQFICESREEAVKSYAEWVKTQPELIKKIKKTLKGKNLICWCAPCACHGDVLIKIANT